MDKDAASGQNFVAASSVLWNSVANGLTQIEGSLKLPFALGDQLSLADLHLMAWLARVLFVAQLVEGESDEIQALSKALQNNILKDNKDAQKGVGENVSAMGAKLTILKPFVVACTLLESHQGKTIFPTCVWRGASLKCMKDTEE